MRALVTPSRTHYFLDGATQRGLTYEGLREFEASLNRRLGRGTLAVRILIIPVHRDGLLSATVADEHIARFWGGVLDHLTVHDGFPIRGSGAIAWAVRKDAPGIRHPDSHPVRQ